MNIRPFETVFLLFLIVMGIAMMPLLAILFDISAYQENLVWDEENDRMLINHERYYIQAVEAHIMGYGLGLGILIGLLALFFHIRLGPSLREADER